MNAKHKNIFLIGPMGAGKSSVGKYLAEKLHMDFYDTDEEIEKSTGVDIGWIFDVEGEEGFRRREEAVVSDLVTRSNVVLATGGGTITSTLSRKLLSENGIVVYLKVSLELQHTRTLNESRRPLLRVPNREEVLEQLRLERDHLYEEIATFSVHTDKRSVRVVAANIVKKLEE